MESKPRLMDFDVRFDVRDCYQLVIITGMTLLTFGVCLSGFGLASMLAEKNGSSNRIDLSQSGQILIGGMTASVIGFACLIIGNKMYPLAWNCDRGNAPWPPYPDMRMHHSSHSLSDGNEIEIDMLLSEK